MCIMFYTNAEQSTSSAAACREPASAWLLGDRSLHSLWCRWTQCHTPPLTMVIASGLLNLKAFPKPKQAQFCGAESDPNLNLAWRNWSESEPRPGPAKLISIQIWTWPGETDLNLNLAAAGPNSKLISIWTQEKQSKPGACSKMSLSYLDYM